jgi:hypothetical protein
MSTWGDSANRHPAEPVPERIPTGIMIKSTRHEPRYRRIEVMCTDHAWRPAEILAWARCPAGWAALIRWPDASEDWRLYSEELIRPLG